MFKTERSLDTGENSNEPISASVRVLRFLQRFRPAESKLFLVLSLLTGGLAGLAVVGYHAFLETMYKVSVGRFVDRPHDWHLFAFPVLGSIIGGILLLHMRNARGSGLNQVRVALIVHNGYVSLTGTIGKFLISGAGIGLGLPLGPEDPAIHIGGGLSSAIGRLLSFSKTHLQQLVTVGSAAGLAAAFNTPVTAVIFTLEEVVGDINAPVLGSTILATVTAVVVRRALLGSQPLFQVPAYQLVSIHELITCAVLGIAGGLLSAGFSRSVTTLRGQLGRIKRGRIIDLVTVGGGVAAGLIGLIAPGTLSVGYRSVNAALNGQLALKVLILLLVFKVIGTGIVFATGNSGGMFAPVLFMGAMLGGTAGAIVQRFFGGDAASVGTYALVGMGVTFAGIIRAPMTSVFMIFELTQDYQIMLPVMIANIISYSVANKLQHKSMFELLTEQDGIHLPDKHDRQLHGLTVADAMRTAVSTFSSGLRVAEAASDASLVSQLDRDRAAIVENGGVLVGVITQAILNRTLNQPAARTTLGEIAAPAGGYRVFPDQPLSVAFSKLGAGAFIVPVVSRLDNDHLLGIVTTEDALRAYGIAQLERGGEFAVAKAAREADAGESEAR